MNAKKKLSATCLALVGSLGSLCLLGAIAGSGPSGGQTDGRQPVAELAVQQLQSDFHAANTLGDYELMFSLWAEDAVFTNPSLRIEGRQAVADFFASGAYWGRVANLSPTYKNEYTIHGNTATYRFECILVDVSGQDPLTTPLSTIPFGAQNPQVEIVQHSTAEGIMVNEGGRWVIKTFNGSAGPQ